MLTPYATQSDLATWAPTITLTGLDVNGLLRSATLVVAKAINENPYTVTPDQVRKDAVCAQAAAWVTAKLNPAGGPAGVGGAVKSKGVDTATVTFDIPTAQTREDALSMLAPDAYNVLYVAGILSIPMPVWNIPIDTSTYLSGSSTDGVRPASYNALNFGYGGY